jgi:hypothetical protein
MSRRLRPNAFDLAARRGRLSEDDPEKWKPVFLATNAERVCAEIMLKQGDEIMIRFNLIGS